MSATVNKLHIIIGKSIKASINGDNVLDLHFTDGTGIRLTGGSCSGMGCLVVTDLHTDELLYDGEEE